MLARFDEEILLNFNAALSAPTPAILTKRWTQLRPVLKGHRHNSGKKKKKKKMPKKMLTLIRMSSALSM